MQIGMLKISAGTDHRKKPERTENAGAECSSGCTMEALYFGDIPGFEDYIRENFGPAELELLLQGRPSSVVLSMTYYPSVNEFRGNKTLQIVIQNYQRWERRDQWKKVKGSE